MMLTCICLEEPRFKYGVAEKSPDPTWRVDRLISWTDPEHLWFPDEQLPYIFNSMLMPIRPEPDEQDVKATWDIEVAGEIT